MPRVEPGGIVQGNPGQQSAVVVHAPPLPTQIPPHTNGGKLLPGVYEGFGTQGRPQQSALVEQACPVFTPASLQVSPFIVQRGMPRMSCWQTNGFWLTLPAQQLFSALHDVVASLQMAPAGRHAWPLSQRPTGSFVLALLHTTPDEFGVPTPPQQSASVRQSSPVGWQPLGGWQMKSAPLYGAQARLQQSPPHAGTPASIDVMPPSVVAAAPQASPAAVQPVVPGGLVWVQRPMVAPACFVQIPPQHSALAAQTSPFCVQYEPLAQRPPLQSLEQQSEPVVQALPLVRHDGLSGAQVPSPPRQLPLQHCAELVHGLLSDVHWVPPHKPLSQTNVQQS